MTAAVQHFVNEQAAKIVTDGLPIGPRLYPCVCGAGKHAHSGAAGVGKCEATGCKRYRADRVWTAVYAALDADAMTLGESLTEYDRRDHAKHRRLNPRGDGEWSIGASDTGTCPKKIEYRNRPPEGFEPAPEDNREARMGTIIHNEVQRWMKALYPWRLFEHKAQIAGLDRPSFIDMYDPITGVVTDFKTAGDWRWDTLADDGPEWKVWEQVLLYALALHEEGYQITVVRLVYIKRCNGHDETFEMTFDDEAIAAAEAARDRLIGYATMLDLGQELPRTGTGPSTDALCRRCFARFDCWNIDRAQQIGRSPESLTILGEEPDDEEVIWAISEVTKASKVRLLAEKAEKEAKTLIEGIETRRYGPNGEWEAYRSTRRGNPDYGTAYREVLKVLDLPDGSRPLAADFEGKEPRYADSVTQKVGRTRKGVLDRERKARAALDKAEKTGDQTLIEEAEQALRLIRSGVEA